MKQNVRANGENLCKVQLNAIIGFRNRNLFIKTLGNIKRSQTLPLIQEMERCRKSMMEASMQFEKG